MARLPWEITREMFLSDEEVKLLLSHVSNRVARKTSLREKDSAELDRVIIFSLLYSGLRTSEFCRLKVADTVVGLSESVFQVQSHGIVVEISTGRSCPPAEPSRQDRKSDLPQSLVDPFPQH